MMQPASPQSELPNVPNLAFAEELYAQFQNDPQSVSDEWRAYFEALDGGQSTPATNGHAQNGHSSNGHQNGQASNGSANGATKVGPSFKAESLFHCREAGRVRVPRGGEGLTEKSDLALQYRVDQLIRNHRVRGHVAAHLDPLSTPKALPRELDPEFYGLTAADMERRLPYETRQGKREMTLRELLEHLRRTYCRYVGVQFMHIDDLGVREWLQEKMERTENRIQLSRREQIRILTRLTDASIFEEFIRRKFVGAKSFSLEGSESLIPLLDLAIEEAGEHGVEEIVLGMAHRGRLNVLANIIGKSPREIFREFEDADADLHQGGGDVKYHLGYVNDWKTASGHTVHLALCFNPSHLEFVNPVALGRIRAKQDRAKDDKRERGMAILIHGDAAFAGQGVVQETLNLSQVPGYRIGGTLHIIVNNQIGFTTSPEEARSTVYASDVAKMLQSPIFHVNGEEPESVAAVVKLASEFRREFKRDVVINMYGYRRLGHNEADEPSFTQPLLYQKIAKRPPVRDAYLDHLLQLGGVTREEADAIADRRRENLEKELFEARSENFQSRDHVRGGWGGYHGGPESEAEHVETAVPRERLQSLVEKLTFVPETFKPHPKITRWIEARRKMGQGVLPLDWAAGEALAFASLATDENKPTSVRLSGKDSERGTFSHRHGVWHDVENGARYYPFRHLAPDQKPVKIYNSPLSETGVLGYEYGYSLDCLDGLVLWEAQFGDFWNVAQPIVDQFITSGEDKWHHLNHLVMLLPHGFEGMGPEHSSARLERWMSLCAEDNIQVAYPTTPAQYFHLLRRHVLRRWRKPLIVMSPKSLLRHLECISELEELTSGGFQNIIPDQSGVAPEKINRILLCSGKIYYELDKKREDLGRDDVAILRMEQLYPFPKDELEKVLAPYREGVPLFWVQEEPANMGAWRHTRIWLGRTAFGKHRYWGVYRSESASPATGSSAMHKREQDMLLQYAFEAQESVYHWHV
jgi:2-oxoglutarate dehydrogenase E1 component